MSVGLHTICKEHMPCVAGERCKLKGRTPSPPNDSNHKCRKCRGHPHGICGAPDPDSSTELHRVCEVTCVSAAGSNTSAKPITSASSRGDGGQKGKKLTLHEKGEVLNLLINMKR